MSITAAPAGYTITVDDIPAYDELAALRQANGWDSDTAQRWAQVFDTAIAVATARDTTGVLVGIGVLSGSPRHAVMCDLDVHPGHRRRGIGTALVHARLAAAAENDCRYVYVALSDDNPFRAVYGAAGITGQAFTGQLVTWSA